MLHALLGCIRQFSHEMTFIAVLENKERAAVVRATIGLKER